MVFATRRLTRPGVPTPAAKVARASAVVAAILQATRLALSAVKAETLVGWLEPVGLVVDGLTMCSSAWCVVWFLSAAGLAGAQRSRVLGATYLFASFVSAAFAVHAVPEPLGRFRGIVSLGFIALGIGGVGVLRRLARGPSPDGPPTAHARDPGEGGYLHRPS